MIYARPAPRTYRRVEEERREERRGFSLSRENHDRDLRPPTGVPFSVNLRARATATREKQYEKLDNISFRAAGLEVSPSKFLP